MKIIFLANTSWNLYNYRLELIEHLRLRGNSIVALSPKDKFTSHLVARGLKWANIDIAARGLNPFYDLWTISQIYWHYRSEKPDIVSHFTIKCVLYGSWVARLLGIKQVINNITGLGYIFSSNNLTTRVLRPLIISLYRSALKNTRVIFQNPDDRSFFISNKIVQEEHTHMVTGSGVVVPKETVNIGAVPPFLVVLSGRMLWSKGIKVFVDAAQQVRQVRKDIRFVLVGDISTEDLDAIHRAVLDGWVKSGSVEWWGWVDDMAQVYQQAHIVCLPTSYGEGIPRSLIEASAHARPIIATDMPGCREIVQPGVNGLLIPPNNPKALAAAVLLLIDNPQTMQKMGLAGQDQVRQKFSIEKILEQNMEIYQRKPA
ncbi:MAG: glycosyltransferase family 1 protein [Chloroflexi bacterium HGW-Chloroflexi-6]|nr:MAG: glycosyltransferase family 1 protein [Chloroflexi bacterium HGW-Chloroflexi-6]